MAFLRAGRQVRTSSAEGDGQAAVDDPHAMNFRVDEIWQESVQREDEGGRLLIPDEFSRKPVAHDPEEKFWDGNHSKGGNFGERHAHAASLGEDLSNLHLERHADELADRA